MMMLHVNRVFWKNTLNAKIRPNMTKIQIRQFMCNIIIMHTRMRNYVRVHVCAHACMRFWRFRKFTHMMGVTGGFMRRNIRASTFNAHTCIQTDQHWYRHEDTCIHHVVCLYHQCAMERRKKIGKVKKVWLCTIYTQTHIQSSRHRCMHVEAYTSMHVISSEMHTRMSRNTG